MDSKLTPQEVKDLRRIIGMTQEQMAVAMGVKLRTIARWEARGNPPQTAATLMKLFATMAMRREEA